MYEKLQQTPNQTPAVNLTGVCKSFGSRVVLDGINFQLTAGQALCVCGANAAGKTTLLKIIAGLTGSSSGMVQIYGFDIKHQAGQIKALVGAIFHQSMIYPQLTVIENLRFFSAVYGAKNSKRRIQQLLEQTHLASCRYDQAGILSRGTMQRLAIARALVHKPRVLLADEPFAGLDNDAGRALVTILRNFKEDGGAIVMTAHNADFAMQCCQEVAVLSDCKLIFNSQVLQDYLLYAKGNS